MIRWLLPLALVAATAQAAVVPMPGPGDPRIRWVRYDPDQVVELRATLGYQMTVEFGDDERIENVSIGDSLGWQITPNRKATLLFVKPVAHGARTNMTVITSLRRYVFELSSRRLGPNDHGDSVIYGLRFSYPVPLRLAEAPPPPPPQPPQDVNHAYSYRGSGRDLPTRVFDDGHATYFSFAETSDYPAILAVDGKTQTMVNSAMRDGFVVVDQLAPAFILRRGKESTMIINQGWREPAPGPLSPVPDKRTKG
jgi:type IV secretion system protein VirB9